MTVNLKLHAVFACRISTNISIDSNVKKQLSSAMWRNLKIGPVAKAVSFCDDGSMSILNRTHVGTCLDWFLTLKSCYMHECCSYV